MNTSSQRGLRVRVPARLHLGFVDMHGGLGRRFGGVGVAIAEPRLELGVYPSATLEVTGEGRERALVLAERFLRLRPEVAGARIEIRRAIPEHRGFGSGTQLTLAIAHSLARLVGLRPSSREIMRTMGRGRRSGVGVATFKRGGIVVDGGKGGSDEPPPLLARLAFPESWRVILITDSAAVGVHGTAESGVFDELPAFSASCAGYLSRVLLMKLLPGVAEADFAAFADATMRLQDCIGDYFSSAQGGRYASSGVGQALEYLRERGVKGIGQSSWGPTGFVFTPGDARARELVAALRRVSGEDTGICLSIVRADNHGAGISVAPAPAGAGGADA